MRKTIYSCLLATAICLHVPANSTPPARSDRQLTGMLDQLSQAEGYSYQVRITSAIAGRKGQEVLHMSNYQSQQNFVVYSKSEEAILLICTSGQYRVNPKEKAVYYSLFPNDPAALQAIKDRMLAQAGPRQLDSMLLTGAHIARKAAAKSIISYRLSYDGGSALTGLSLVYDAQRSFFTSISYTMQRPVPGSESLKDGKPALMQQEVVMDHYVQQMPPELPALLEGARDMAASLGRQYPGYKIQKINL